jgi:glycosyl transferase family 25
MDWGGRAGEVPRCPEELTRYELALGLSRRETWCRFLLEGSAFCCVLEDDVILSPDFPAFMEAEDWLPAGASIIKIEALTRRKLLLGRQECAFMGRALRPLMSNHLGTAGSLSVEGQLRCS